MTYFDLEQNQGRVPLDGPLLFDGTSHTLTCLTSTRLNESAKQYSGQRVSVIDPGESTINDSSQIIRFSPSIILTIIIEKTAQNGWSSHRIKR